MTSASARSKVIVVFKEDTPKEEIDRAIADVEAQGGKIGHRYDSVMLGFSAELPEFYVQTLNTHPHIDYIENDGVVTTQ